MKESMSSILKRTSQLLILSLFLLISCGDWAQNTRLSILNSETESVVTQIQKKYGVSVSRLQENDTRLPWFTRFTTSYNPVLNPNREGAQNTPLPYPSSDIDISYPDNFTNILLNNHLIDEFNKYPVNFFREQKIHDIFFVEELKAGFLFVQFDVYGIGFNLNNEKVVIIATEAPFDTRFVTTALHHELFHVIDDNLIWGEESWEKCQPTRAEKKRFHHPNSKNYHPEAGFVSLYAQSVFREDKAEVYRFVFSGGQLSQYLDHWINQGDSALKCKRDWIKKYLENRFPEFNERYFKYLNLGLKGNDLQTAVKYPLALKKLDLSESPEVITYSSQNGDPGPPPDFNLASSPKAQWQPPKINMPSGLGELAELKELILYNNQWHTLAADLKQLSQLEKLSISGQELSDFPPEILDLKALKQLTIYTEIMHLPKAIRQLKNLTELHMATAQDHDYSPLQNLKLEVLEIAPIGRAEDSPTMALPKDILALKNLKELSLSKINDPALALPHQWQNLTSLTLELPNLKSPIEGLIQLKQLKHLSLLNLPETFKVPRDLLSLKTLETLRISFSSPSQPQPSLLLDALLDLPHLKFISIGGALDSSTQTGLNDFIKYQNACEKKGINCSFF